MKNNPKKRSKKEFDAMETIRAIKEKISLEMKGMSVEQMVVYIQKNSEKLYDDKPVSN